MSFLILKRYQLFYNSQVDNNLSKNSMKNVKVFSTPTCPYCHMAKVYLQDKKVSFEDIDVSQDQNQARAMVEKSGEMGVPQLWIDDEVVIGFNKPVIDQLLGL